MNLEIPPLVTKSVYDSRERPNKPSTRDICCARCIPPLFSNLFLILSQLNQVDFVKTINSTLGASVDFGKVFSVRGMYGGKEPHLMFNYFYK